MEQETLSSKALLKDPYWWKSRRKCLLSSIPLPQKQFGTIIPRDCAKKIEIVSLHTFIHICCEFTWVRDFALKLIRTKMSPGRTSPTFSPHYQFLSRPILSGLLLLCVASKCNIHIQIDFYWFLQFTWIKPPHVNRGLSVLRNEPKYNSH